MHPRIPAVIQPLLTDYLRLLADQSPDLVTGLYLHGSIALDAFNEQLSDIDCVAFLSRAATTDDLARLRDLHQTIATRYPRWLLECSYLQWGDLGLLEEAVAPHPVFHDGKLEAAGNFDINSVTWWVLQQRGIALIGSPPDVLPLHVDWQTLTTRMHENLNTFWASYGQTPRRIAWLLTDYGVQWCVLGTLRQYYTFVAHDITSKQGAGDYALRHLPIEWHAIIREALRLRAGTPDAHYHSRVVRAADTYRFLRYIIQHCNNLPT